MVIRSLLGLLVLPFLGCDTPTPISKSSKPDCFVGMWGNDYLLCGTENSGKPGKGNAQKRLAEELRLTFINNNRGEFSFYDCQTGKRFSESIPFSFTTAGDTLRFTWEGSPEQARHSAATFHFQNAFYYRCQGDTLHIPALMTNTLYNGATYFVRRN